MIKYTPEPNTKVGNLTFLRRLGAEHRYKCVFLCPLCNEEMLIQMAEANRGQQSCMKCSKRGSKNPGYKHGDTVGGKECYSITYKVYSSMIARCYAESSSGWENYGGRGIKVCDRWLGGIKGEGYKRFLEDMGERPSKEYSIDRINTNGNYEPNNCKWSTAKEQGQTRRVSINKTIDIIIGMVDKYPNSINTVEEYTNWVKEQLEKLKVRS